MDPTDLHERYCRCVAATSETMGPQLAQELCMNSVYHSRGVTTGRPPTCGVRRKTERRNRRRRSSSERRRKSMSQKRRTSSSQRPLLHQ